MGRRNRFGHDGAMQTASPVAPPRRARITVPAAAVVAGRAVLGIAWLALAVTTAWLAFGTPLLAELASPGTRGTAEPIVGAAIWAVALTAPAAFAILGLARVAGAIGHARSSRRDLPPIARRAALLPPGCGVIPRIRLPQGPRVPDVVVGPHGVVIFEALPPPAAARRTGERWEVRFADVGWRSIENPLHHATRDAERLRRYLEGSDRDHVVRVTAAVLGDPGEVRRTEACAVVEPDDVPGWLAALPAQRGLTPERIADLRAALEAIATA